MTMLRTFLAAALLAGGGLVLPMAVAPAAAAVDASDPQRFVQTLTTDAFAAARSGGKAQAQAKFRAMLANNVAVDQVGDRLIRRWLPTISAEQKAAYKAALPTYLVGTYSDNLLSYSDAKVTVLSAQPTSAGMANVLTSVAKPGRQPVKVTWQLTQVGGAWKVSNLVVAGINVALAQAADFDSVVQRQGFDALVKMMRARG